MGLDPHVFAGNPLDRASNERRDAEWLAACLAHPDARYLAFRELEVLADPGPPPELAWRGADQLAAVEAPPPVLLGLRDDVPHLAVDVSALDGAALDGLAAGTAFVEARGIAPGLSLADAGVLAQARSLVDWHARHRFCARCGGPTKPRSGGGARRCEACAAEHFPRVDPVVIVLVTRGERCLLARPGTRPGPMYTCVAGFMEPGETIEEAVRREVLEETGVAVGAVCHADATSGEIAVDLDEIADAQWFERADVAKALEASEAGWEVGVGAPFGVPPPMTIAHQLIRAWAPRS
jgi:NAD+ diphosphatase